jgi:DNA repair protein RadC
MSEKSKHEAHRVRLRERFLVGEAASHTDEALLELLLTFGIPRCDVQPLAKALLSRFGSLDNVLAADQSALLSVDGIKSHIATLLKLTDYIGQARGTPRPSPKLQEHPGSVLAPAAPRPELPEPPIATTTPLAQSEMPLNLPGQSELPLAQKEPATRERKTIQDVLIAEGLLALKTAHEATSPEQLQEILMKRLGQNSAETRRRYAQSILKWFFPDGLQGLLPRAWRAYQDEAISTDLLRWSYLSQEPIIGRCVADALFPCENGLAMPATYFDKFLRDSLGEPAPEKTRERLKINLKRIGFLERAKGKPDRLVPVVTQKTSLLILVHHLFAAKAVRTVELRNLFTNPFWKFLGYKSEDAVKAALREADAKGLIGKYVVADQLEQVTTCFTLDELLERKARL